MKTILLTHANLKVPVQVAASKIFYLYTSPTHGCVHIISDAGSICPVAETEEQILRILMNTSNMEGNKANGIAKEGS